MKKAISVIIISALSILIIFGIIYSVISADVFYTAKNMISDEDAQAAFDLLYNSLDNSRYTYFEYIEEHDAEYAQEDVMAYPVEEQRNEIEYQVTDTFTADVEKSGLYNIKITYKMNDNVLNNSTLALKINGETPFYEAGLLDLPIYWQDDSKSFNKDSYGDESLPAQNRIPGDYSVSLNNNLYYTVEPMLFYFDKGSNVLEFTNQSSSSFIIKKIELISPKVIMTYNEYKNAYTHNPIEQSITVNAIDYVMKNSSYVSMLAYESPTVEPFDPIDKKLNIISGSSWKNPGKDITYVVDVEQAGYYKLALHTFPGNDDYKVFRTIRIDGEIPFTEVMAYAFEDSRGNRFNYETLASEEGVEYEFYLSEGQHEITFTVEHAPISEQVRRIQLVTDHINQFALDIRKVTGKEVDKNRTWRITEYIPETEQYLRAYDILIKDIIEELAVYAPNSVNSATLSDLQKALVKIDKMLEKPDELPLYLDDLYSGTGSVNQMLGNTIDSLIQQPMSINEFTLYTGELDKKANANLFTKFSASVKKFISSFTSDKYVVRNDEEMLNIWVNRPITHVDTLQKMVDAEFTPETGIKVKISVMPDANKLILASAAGTGPDVAMGLLSYMPYDLAIRGAAYDMSEFDDFWTVANRFTPGAFVPYVLEDDVYALPETLEFQVLIYRKDIFDSLGYEVPDTWDDVTELLPELQRYGMNFFHPISGVTSLKWFYQTSPFIYQKGGTLYAENGLTTTLDEQEAVEGLEYLSKLFTMYSLPEQEPLFYNAFRYGKLPVGIADFNQYVIIKNAAPELVGKWEIAPYPAMEDSDGNMNRWIISNGRGSVIMQDTDKADEAWEFLKWWSSTEVQTAYSYTLQSVYGPEYLWLSGNIEAVENSSIDIEDKLVILEQIKWLRDVPRIPGQYMLERGISDIWNRSVYNNEPTRIAIDKQVIAINREIQRKMIEFGYLDNNGEVIIPYPVRDIDWIIEQMETLGEGEK